MKKMVDQLVYEVRNEQRRANISHTTDTKVKVKKKFNKKDSIIGYACPKCTAGRLLKGKTAYGCDRYADGCDFRIPFRVNDKKVSDKQYLRLLQKGATIQLKGFKTPAGVVSGILSFDAAHNIILNKKETSNDNVKDKLRCPQCKKGMILKGKSAYGCSAYTAGCDFQVSFDFIRQKASGNPLTKEFVQKILLENG